MSTRLIFLVAVAVVSLASLSLAACKTPIPPRDPGSTRPTLPKPQVSNMPTPAER